MAAASSLDRLRTARLLLRRPTHDDVDTILRIHRDERACAHNPSDMIFERSEAEERYQRWDQHWVEHGFGYWVIDGPESVLGFCGLKSMRLGDRPVLNLFYRLDPSAWGAGVATEAATAVVRWAATAMPESTVIARVLPGNIASAKVAIRAGLRRAESLDTAGEDGLDHLFISVTH